MKHFLLLFAFVIATPSFGQSRINIDEEIEIGGVKQFITIRGTNSSHPILLFLHGGPGGSMMSYADKFTNKLRNHFIVVQWDQRETGRTKELNSSPIPLSFEVFVNDTHELIRNLLDRFNQKKLYLVGYSWGTAPGFMMVRQHPELLHAYIAISPMINQLESERMALELMKEKAVRNKNENAQSELAEVRVPFENGGQLYFHRKWVFDLMGSRTNVSREYVEQWAGTWLHVFNEASEVDLTQTLASVKCPVYIFAGKKDHQTSSAIAEKYYNMLNAPRKGFYWFDTGHTIPSAAPSRMQDLIVGTILPDTFNKSF